jgi:hypothetical protein
VYVSFAEGASRVEFVDVVAKEQKVARELERWLLQCDMRLSEVENIRTP